MKMYIKKEIGRGYDNEPIPAIRFVVGAVGEDCAYVTVEDVNFDIFDKNAVLKAFEEMPQRKEIISEHWAEIKENTKKMILGEIQSRIDALELQRALILLK